MANPDFDVDKIAGKVSYAADIAKFCKVKYLKIKFNFKILKLKKGNITIILLFLKHYIKKIYF